MFSEYGSISCIHALSSILKFHDGGRSDGQMVGRTEGYVKIMPLVAPTPQLKLRWTELSWSVGAECGNSRSRELAQQSLLLETQQSLPNCPFIYKFASIHLIDIPFG